MKRFAIIFLILVILIGVGGWYWYQHHSAQQHNTVAEPTLVSTVTAKVKIIPLQVKAIGQVIAPQTVMLKTQVAGPITDIYFKSGEYVKRNQLLVQMNPIAARAVVAQQFANYSNLKTQYDRLIRLSKLSDGADVSADQITQEKNNMLAAKAEWQAAKKQLDDTQIRAPFSGIIGLPQAVLNQVAIGGNAINETVPLSVGTYLAEGAPIAILSNTKEMLVQYQVSEAYSGLLKLGQPVAVRFMAFPNKVFQGHVTYISPLVFQNTQAYNVRASIDDPQDLLRSGMNANVTQTIEANRKIVAIPGLALVPSLSGYAVYTIDKNKVKETPVTIGQRFNGLVAITSGLKAGDAVIQSGRLNVHPGMMVQVKK